MNKEYWEEVKELANSRQLSDIELYNKAIDTYGHIAQIGQVVEEMAELAIELNRFLNRKGRSNTTKIAEEVADVKITLNQLEIIMERVDKEFLQKEEESKKYKNARLEKNLNDVKEMNFVD